MRRAKRTGELAAADLATRSRAAGVRAVAAVRAGGRGPLGRAVLDSGDGDPRGDVADRQGDVVLLSEEPVAPPRRQGVNDPNTAQAWLWNPATGNDQACRSAVVARPGRRSAQAGQHLVRRPDLHRRWAAGGLRRQPALLRRLGRLQGPQQGLHLQPLVRDLDRAARHAPRTLVSDRRQAGRRAHRDHSTGSTKAARASSATRTSSSSRRRRTSTGAAQSACSARSAATGQPPVGGLYPHMFAMPSGRTMVAGTVPRGHLVPQPTGRVEQLHVAGLPEQLPRPALGHRVLVPGGTGGSTRVMQLGGSAPPTIPLRPPTRGADDRGLRRGKPLGRLAGATPSMQVGRGHHNTVLLARRLDGHGRRRRRHQTARRPVGRPTPPSARSSSGIPPPATGRSAPPRPNRAPTTPPRCCSQTAA